MDETVPRRELSSRKYLPHDSAPSPALFRETFFFPIPDYALVARESVDLFDSGFAASEWHGCRWPSRDARTIVIRVFGTALVYSGEKSRPVRASLRALLYDPK